ncbi:LRR domain containing protein [Parasponia andersonii]|uniref:LRR domain containing protein n=1 Tax=Parasponia andersonii TaxID=3476 RepID=A0A2P5CSK6_PARAD|nr:LRR domain containing protein [Parasponia andersonii]
MESLRNLDLTHTAIKELPTSIKNLIGLCDINMGLCENLKILPSSMYNISHLESLFVSNCPRLENLPAMSIDLCHLSYLDLSYCNLLEIPDSLGCLSSLENLDLRGNIFEEIPESIKQLSKLTMLKISNCENLRSLPELPLFLELLYASGCTSLETLQNFSSLTNSCWDDYDVKYREELLFYNSLKLDQNTCNSIVTEFQMRVLHTAAACVLKLTESNESKDSRVSICCIGNEVPKWFSYQSEGSSIDINLSLQWHNNNFLGFALCAVVEFGNYHSNCEYLNFYCMFHLKNSSGGSQEFCWTFPNWENGELKRNSEHPSSNHVFMWYQNEGYRDCLDAVEASFDFFLRDDMGVLVESGNCKVKRCGICLLYLHEVEEIARIINDRCVFGEPCIEGMIEPSRGASAAIKSDTEEQGEQSEPSRSDVAKEGGEEKKVQRENAVIETDKEEEEHEPSTVARHTEQLEELARNIVDLDINNVQSHQLEELVENIMNYFDNGNDIRLS